MRLGAGTACLIAAMILSSSCLRAAEKNDTDTHVRGTTLWLRGALVKGQASSPTFRRLVATLNASDMFVYLMPLHRDRRPGTIQGYVPHRVQTAGAFRYITVAIRYTGTDERALALIAHELQHVSEIAADRRVGRGESVEGLFERISRVACDVGACYETDAALDVEAAVLNEVSLARRERRRELMQVSR